MQRERFATNAIRYAQDAAEHHHMATRPSALFLNMALSQQCAARSAVWALYFRLRLLGYSYGEATAELRLPKQRE